MAARLLQTLPIALALRRPVFFFRAALLLPWQGRACGASLSEKPSLFFRLFFYGAA